MADFDLQEFALACKAFGIYAEVKSPTEIRFYPCGPSFSWDGVSNDWNTTGLLVGAIKAKVAELEGSGTGDAVKDEPNRRAYVAGRDFLRSPTEALTTTLAATALLEMWKSAEPGARG